MDVRQTRKTARMSQFELSIRTGISRMRLSHAENGYLALTPEELSAIKSAVRSGAEKQVKKLHQITQ